MERKPDTVPTCDARTAKGRVRRRLRRAMINGGIGLGILAGLGWLGGLVGKGLRLPLPGAAIGLAGLTLVLLGTNRFFLRSHRRLTLRLLPASRGLLSHMSLLFVPAGVGIVTESEALRRDWLPLAAGVIGSTWIGLAATAWVMERLAARKTARDA